MDFHGFSSVKQYEAECASHGYSTRRVKLSGPVPGAFALITTPPTATGIEVWDLIGAEDTPQDVVFSILNSDRDYFQNLRELGYTPLEPSNLRAGGYDPCRAAPAQPSEAEYALVIPAEELEQVSFF